ncbi:MAG: hypothetical protein JWM78_3442 [Verrucomicrobiaceae bacterium]|nr:hypothetical protein [Verrucomicrobiaceae bacterium]
MTTPHPRLLLIAALFSAAAGAQQDETDSTPNLSWRQNTIARCELQYRAEQCWDEQFLEENFHLSTLETAHRTATRRKQLENGALRELTLQHVCNQSISKTCSGASNSAQCETEIIEACRVLQTQAATCLQNAAAQCADNTDPSTCTTQRSAFCPSLQKQSIQVFLAKYPKFTLEQKTRLASASQQLDAQDGSWFPNLFNWLGLLF